MEIGFGLSLEPMKREQVSVCPQRRNSLNSGQSRNVQCTAGHLAALPRDMMFRKKQWLGYVGRDQVKGAPKLIFKHFSGI